MNPFITHLFIFHDNSKQFKIMRQNAKFIKRYDFSSNIKNFPHSEKKNIKTPVAGRTIYFITFFYAKTLLCVYNTEPEPE